MTKKKTFYYLPGQGGRLRQGLGAALLERNTDVQGQEIHGDFQKADFATRVSIVADDLKRDHWGDDSLVIANSYGAYLFLHAQAELSAYPGRVLLLSPIVGEFDSEELQIGFIPPRARKIFEMATTGTYPVPVDCQIHVGSEDWQSNPKNVAKLGLLFNIPVHVVPNNGHMLEKGYVAQVLDTWLAQ